MLSKSIQMLFLGIMLHGTWGIIQTVSDVNEYLLFRASRFSLCRSKPTDRRRQI